ncbi:MAG: phosphoglucosamine mutase [Flavobacteriales bacterium]|nr:phosphoglucosamine mutase [Bacteroidota bacterium]MCB9239771.1 phosphoglucosamine mutase [Flavobacteriales bacterium]
MTLIKSISGIRGTIGGREGDGLTPIDAVKFAGAYAQWIKAQGKGNTIVIGRDARLSGPMISGLVINTLIGMGMDVIDLGLSTTPTVEVAVPELNAAGGIILTASHNPGQWNALKLLNHHGEFISGADGAELLRMVEAGEIEFSAVDQLGTLTEDSTWIDKHIERIVACDEVKVDAIRNRGFKVVVDAVNSTGGIAIPALLKRLGVTDIVEMYCEPTGHFPHNPEPLAENLTAISAKVVETNADLGIVVDPDVDRLCFVMENGEMFGEEYTLVAVADYLLSLTPGNTVSNLSSTRALADVTTKHGGHYSASAVGEVNVVTKMKEVNAVIGGEGNGGVIWPKLHYGRDALAGVGLFLTLLAERGGSISALRKTYPHYEMSKNKIELKPEMDIPSILKTVANRYAHENINTIDGVKIDFADEWVHLRPSNTEPIIRIYSESSDAQRALDLTEKIKSEVLQGI